MKKENINFKNALNAAVTYPLIWRSAKNKVFEDKEFLEELIQIHKGGETAEEVADKVYEKYGNVLKVIKLQTVLKIEKRINDIYTLILTLVIIGAVSMAAAFIAFIAIMANT